MVEPDQPAHAILKAVEDKVVGARGGCAGVFGATEEAGASGLRLVRETDIAGTTSVLDLSRYGADGAGLLTFRDPLSDRIPGAAVRAVPTRPRGSGP